ncbi:MAG: hypothetical protein ACXWWR_01885 [Candidatus Limnocylindrales bacterium]
MPFLPHVSPDHDETLVVGLAADDLAPRELEAARGQVADCPACAELLADLRSIATATARLPRPQRTRDFRLTEADAARLRSPGWRRLLARLGSPGFAFTKPLAGGLAALGIAGLILASLPSAFGGAASSSGAFNGDGAGAGAAPSAALAPALVPDASGEARDHLGSGPLVAPRASAGIGVTTEGGGSKGSPSGPEAAAAPSASGDGAPVDLSARRDGLATAGPPSPLVVLSVVLLAAAVVLIGLRLIGRRLA